MQNVIIHLQSYLIMRLQNHAGEFIIQRLYCTCIFAVAGWYTHVLSLSPTCQRRVGAFIAAYESPLLWSLKIAGPDKPDVPNQHIPPMIGPKLDHHDFVSINLTFSNNQKSVWYIMSGVDFVWLAYKQSSNVSVSFDWSRTRPTSQRVGRFPPS